MHVCVLYACSHLGLHLCMYGLVYDSSNYQLLTSCMASATCPHLCVIELLVSATVPIASSITKLNEHPGMLLYRDS